MKVVHITNCLLAGGIQNFLVSLLPEQAKLGLDVSLIVIEADTEDYCGILADKMRRHGVKVYNLGKRRSNKISMLKTIIGCRKLLRSLSPHVIHTHGTMSHIYGDFSKRGLPTSHILTVHNSPERWGFLCNILNKSKALIYCSESAYNLRVQKNSNIVAIDNGVSAGITKTEEVIDLRKELGLKATDRVVVSVGSLRPQKNYEFLKQVVDSLRDENVHFCVCGGAYGPGYISTEGFKKYNNIHFLGLRSDVSAIENGSDVFLSCASFEGLPIAVLEAFFNGIPCVLSPIEQHKKIAIDVPACFIPVDFDGKSFADVIRKALEVKKSHEEICAERAPAIDKYSISTTAKKYIEFYNKNIVK